MMKQWIQTLLVVAAASVTCHAGYIGTTQQGGNPSGELEKLLALLESEKTDDTIFITKDDKTFEKKSKGGLGVEASKYTYESLDFLGDLSKYETLFVGVKAATGIDWYTFGPKDLEATFSTQAIWNERAKKWQSKDISHISFFGILAPPEEEGGGDPPATRVSDNGPMWLMLGGGLVALAAWRHRMGRASKKSV
jgi:hypothetical protein